MSPTADLTRTFKPGTLGWTARDLDDPAVESRWFGGRYEIIEGVLTEMPAAYFTGGSALLNLLFLLKQHASRRGPAGSFAVEADIVISQTRVVVTNAIFMTPADRQKQAEAVRRESRPDPRRSRIYVPPTLIIESVSPGKERHDWHTKRRWYAEFGVPHYWLLNAYDESLECLVLDAGSYGTDQSGRADERLGPGLFPGLVIPLDAVWG